MELDIQDSMAGVVEHGIRPPMAQVITVPITVQMGARGVEVILYICTSPFGQHGVPTSDRELKAITAEVVKRLKASNG